MSTRNVFNVELTKIAFQDKKVIVGNKAKKLDGSKKALSLRLSNPQVAAESDIDSMVYVVAEVGGPLKKGSSIVVDQSGETSLLNPEKTSELFLDLGTSRSEILTAGVRSVVDRAKNNEGLMNSLNLDSNGPLVKAETLDKIDEVANKGQRIADEAKIENELSVSLSELEQDSPKKPKRKGGLRNN